MSLSSSSSRPRVVVIGDPADPLLQSLPARDDASFVVAHTEAALAAAAPAADAILAWWTTGALLDLVLERAPRARWVHSIATGIDRIASQALRDHPCVMTNTRDVFSPALAEFALLGILFFAKNVPRLEASRRARTWDPFEMETLHGKVLGLVGYGSIGRATARLAAAFGMKIHVYRRNPRAAPEPLVTKTVLDKRELFATADAVVLAAPLTPETHHIAGGPELSAMKPSAVLVNVGRGALVDERALVDALAQRRIRGAALDVFETEPLPPEHPFFERDDVLLSPHSADRTATWQNEALALFFVNLTRFREGKPLLHPVDKARGY